MADIKESSWDALSCNDYATYFSTEKKNVQMIKALKEKYPDEVEIVMEYDDDTGIGVMAHLPKTWCKISPKRKRNITPEELEVLRERMELARKKKSGVRSSDSGSDSRSETNGEE